MIKYIQGKFICWDIFLYDKNNSTPAIVQTSTLNEDLGQVKFIFSDKTGTLTKNYMEFKNMSVGKYSYGIENRKFISNILKFINFRLIAIPNEKSDDKGDISNFNFYYEEFLTLLKNENHENYYYIQLYLSCLATCHTVNTHILENSKMVFQSSSPDETALINAARYFGYIFTGKGY
jgi:magnesium-transporting ATPase (P-type)